MITRRVKLGSRALGAVLAAGALSGCFLNPDAMPPNNVRQVDQLYHSFIRLQPAVVEPQVETVTMIHRVAFAYGVDAIEDREAARLDAFLAEVGADSRSRVEVDGPRRAGGAHDLMTAARLDAIVERLSAKGLQAAVPSRSIEALNRPEDAIVVTVTRAMVIEPDCEVPKTIYGPRPTNVWSCTSSVALGRMVADPLDLERGRTLGPGDGEALSLGVTRYRTGEIKPLKTESTN